jgi:hypothetical protein
MNMKPKKRNNHYVDPQIRAALNLRIAFYWSACLAFSLLPLLILTTLAQPEVWFTAHFDDLVRRFWPLYVMLLALLPFVMRDALRVTNRTLGPIARLQNELRAYQDTGKFTPVSFREDDFLGDLIQLINNAIGTQSSTEETAEIEQAV